MVLAKRYRWPIAGAALAAVAAAGIFLLVRGSGLSAELADGVYSSDCCGTIELRDGRMTANGANLTSYTIGRDERGPYLLPGRYVGAFDGGIALDGSTPALKLRLDRLPGPARIDVPGLRGPERFDRSVRRRR